jgi:hypothetical protein
VTAKRIWVFFYGSYMNRGVLREVALEPMEWLVARLRGFDVRIAPRANHVRSPERSVCGVLARVSGALRPALSYSAPEVRERPAETAYVDRILARARELGFPGWYLERLLAFRRDREL